AGARSVNNPRVHEPGVGPNERRDALPDWLHEYNQHRPHTACGGQPPFSRLINVPGQYT
ncbi:integrase core domain-containing protein, partial [Brachybacterium nesterenkovii]|uniref:integrase core domain-containing protein n=1 Tax=Brachybacterium nesterenkovii TaxID=47847 RepID=UPI001177CFCB